MQPKQLNRYMHGTVPGLDVLDRLAKHLLVTPAELLMSPAELEDRGHDLAECYRRLGEAIDPKDHGAPLKEGTPAAK